jgi:hypothetical protein
MFPLFVCILHDMCPMILLKGGTVSDVILGPKVLKNWLQVHGVLLPSRGPIFGKFCHDLLVVE